MECLHGLLENGYKGKMKRLELADNFIQHGSRDKILKTLNLDADGIVKNYSRVYI